MLRYSLITLIVLCHFSSNLNATEFVGISDKDFQIHYRAQQGKFLCWATCAEMVLAHQGIKLPADAIVKKIKGFKTDSTGSYADMLKSTNGIFKDVSDQQVVVSGQMIGGAPFSTVLYTTLKNKKPIILLYRTSQGMGHAVVLTGADVTIDKSSGEITVEKFHVFDPFCYRRVIDFKGNRLEEDKGLIKRVYHPRLNFNQMQIEAGVISAVIVIEGATL
jgi:hypothetical protein